MRVIVNVHVAKRDIQNETVRRIVENAIRGYLNGEQVPYPNQKVQYIELESVEIGC